jgi:hypothetical protein
MSLAAVEGWRSVEELVRWRFAHAPVVMANEAHSGLAGVDALIVSSENTLT